MFESIINFFKKIGKQDKEQAKSKDAAKERLQLVLMQDRANVSADFLDLMKQEIIEVIKKYIDVDENAIDVRLTNKENSDGTTGAPALYASIPIVSIKEEAKDMEKEKASQKDVKEKPEENIKKEKAVEEKKEDDEKQKETQEEKQEEKLEQEEVKKEEIEEEEAKVEKQEEKESDKTEGRSETKKEDTLETKQKEEQEETADK